MNDEYDRGYNNQAEDYYEDYPMMHPPLDHQN